MNRQKQASNPRILSQFSDRVKIITPSKRVPGDRQFREITLATAVYNVEQALKQ
jgi:hypothetical protein